MASIEVMLTIEPPLPWARICAAAARMQRNVPRTLTSRISSNSAGCMFSSRKFENTPALLTRMSSRPKVSTAAATSRATSASTEMSPMTASAARPSASSRVQAASSRSERTSAITTEAPASASLPAHAKPKPWAAPVTRAVRPLRSTSIRSGVAASSCTAGGYKIIRAHERLLGAQARLRGSEGVATLLIGYDTEAAAVGEGLARFLSPAVPQYRAALDPDVTRRGVRLLARLHEELAAPCTLFVCGRTLLQALDALEPLAASPLFDLQQHTYSHVVFRDVRYQAEGAETEAVIAETPHVALRAELQFTSELIRKYLGRECIGVRTPFGYYRGLRGRPDLLDVGESTGKRFVE